MLVAEGGQIAQLSQDSFQQLNAFLPSAWSRNNPVDVLGDAGADRYIKAIEVVTADPNIDGVLAIVTPQAMTDPIAIAKGLESFKNLSEKPILASWMGAADVAEGEAILNRCRIPTFKFPDAAARTFCYMWRYSESMRALYETPALAKWNQNISGQISAEKIIQDARKHQRTILTEVESKQVLEAYGIPTVKTLVALTEDDAVRLSSELGPPVVLKLYSEVITHKTDVGGVKLNLRTEGEIREAYQAIQGAVQDKPGAFLGVTVEPMIRPDGYELILGSSIDPQFGPVLLFGSGGQLVEVTKDDCLALPPLDSTFPRRIMVKTHIYSALKAFPYLAPVDLQQLETVLVRVSLLVPGQPWIEEIDSNPLVAPSAQNLSRHSPRGGPLLASQTRIVLHGSPIPEAPPPPLAIRPYPQEYASTLQLKAAALLTLRPILPQNQPPIAQSHSTF